MLALDFPGSTRLVDSLTAAVCHDCPTDITDALRNTLCELIRDPEVKLPDCCYERAFDHYARRELYRSEKHGFSVIAMTWGPGQGTPIHDHAGMWCVEGVLCGDIDVTQYELLEQQGERYRFRRQGTVSAGVGNAGALIPPFEYHTIANSSASEKAVTVHVYAGEMTSCTVFVPQDDGWHDRQERQLSYCE